jgi:hypothetical protein
MVARLHSCEDLRQLVARLELREGIILGQANG